MDRDPTDCWLSNPFHLNTLGSKGRAGEREPSRVGFLSCKKKKMWQTVGTGRGVNLGFTWLCVALNGSIWIRAGVAGRIGEVAEWSKAPDC